MQCGVRTTEGINVYWIQSMDWVDFTNLKNREWLFVCTACLHFMLGPSSEKWKKIELRIYLKIELNSFLSEANFTTSSPTDNC